MTDVQKILLGAACAVLGGLIGGVLLDFVRSAVQDRKRQKLLRTLLVVELREIVDLIDRLPSNPVAQLWDWGQGLASLGAALPAYERNRDWVMLFPEALRREVVSFYRKLSNHVRAESLLAAGLAQSAGNVAMVAKIGEARLALRKELESLAQLGRTIAVQLEK